MSTHVLGKGILSSVLGIALFLTTIEVIVSVL
jgi:hypothetical protein